MAYLVINGRKEKVPPFPHHKEYIYRCRQFFFANGLLTHLVMDRFVTFREFLHGFRHRCLVPRSLLIDPTSNCNLNCKGCWACDYSKGDNLSFEKLDDIITQAKKLGISDILMSGGEPLVRKDDIIKLCEKHRKNSFGMFTNGTLVDEAFADKLKTLGNLNLFFSIEGFREETDFRRGNGVFDKVIRTMELLRNRNIGFAFSACYHSQNYKVIASDEFLDFMRQRGCWFGWLFNYIPIGSDSDLSLVLKAEQRAYVQKRISEYSKKTNFMIIDFWNNGHVAFGCVAAGSGFVHINARGDVEPCAFCHYSDSNIHEMSLVEALRSPFFKSFRKAQPFNENSLRSCPLVDMPGKIIELAEKPGIRSTHLSAPESPSILAGKMRPFADEWKPVAEEIYNGYSEKNRKNFSKFMSFIKIKKMLSDGIAIKKG